MVAKLPIISVKSLSLPSVLTKVESRHDSTNHASMFLDETSGKAERALAAHRTLRAKKDRQHLLMLSVHWC